MADGVDREFPKRQTFELDIHSTGTAFAYDLSDTLSVGAAVQVLEFSIDATNKVFTARDAQKFQPPNYSDPQNLEVVATQTGDDHAWAMTVGALWDVSPQWTVGASFRQGPQFEFATRTVLGPNGGNRVVSEQSDNPFNVPDTFSVGALYRVTDFWRVSVEYDRINFHQLIDDFRNTALFPGDPEADLVADRARLNNANQFRLGVERLGLMSGGRVLALRGGAWYDPNHQTFFEANESTGLPAPRWAVLLPRRDGAWHVSTGAGLTLHRHLQIDAAIDVSDPVDTFALSAVWRF
jgi:long-subunit fatty acid transport protein